MKRSLYIIASLALLCSSAVFMNNCSRTNELSFDAKKFSSELGTEKTLDLTKLTYYFRYDAQVNTSYTSNSDQSVTSIKNIVDDPRWNLSLTGGNVFLSNNCIKSYPCFSFNSRQTSTFQTQLSLNAILKSGTLFVVAKLSEGNLIAWGADHNENSITLGKENNLGVLRVYTDSANYKERLFTIPTDTTASTFVITFRDDNIASIMVDGLIPGVSANVSGNNPTYTDVTRKWIFGTANAKGSIGEISLTPTTLTKAQMRAASNFLVRKWGLATRNPTGNNYASGEPPPLGGIDDSINDGASGGGSGEAVPISFTAEIKPLLQARCGACHSSWINDYSQLISSARIVPNNAEVSPIYTRINNNSMPPAGVANPLNNSEKEKIYNWITQGAKNN